MTHDVYLQIIAAAGIFLLGVNLAFLLNLGSRLVRWFTFKITAVTAMLLYIVLSVTYGDPTVGRATIGFAAMCLDMLAVAWMWYSVSTLRDTGVRGLVPLIREDDPE